MIKGGFTESSIVDLLGRKHSEDVFFAGVKSGQSYGPNFKILDAWAMAKSWARPWCAGYEIKISRADFLADDKWPGYLPLCNRFSFVAPKGVIRLSEIGREIGLIEVVGNRLVTRIKAAHRSIAPPVGLYCYLLMSRTEAPATIDQWRCWLQQKEESQKVGREVAQALARVSASAKMEAKRCQALVASYEEVRATLLSLGFNPESEVAAWDLRRKVECARRCIPDDMESSLARLENSLRHFRAAISQLEQTP